MVLQKTAPGVIPDDVISRWKDGSILKDSKTEAIQKFGIRFGYKSSRRWEILLKQEAPATPDQYHFVVELINEYWLFFNPDKVTEDFSNDGSNAA